MARITDVRTKEEALFYKANFRQALAVSIVVAVPAFTFMVVCLSHHLIYGHIDAAEVACLTTMPYHECLS